MSQQDAPLQGPIALLHTRSLTHQWNLPSARRCLLSRIWPEKIKLVQEYVSQEKSVNMNTQFASASLHFFTWAGSRGAKSKIWSLRSVIQEGRYYWETEIPVCALLRALKLQNSCRAQLLRPPVKKQNKNTISLSDFVCVHFCWRQAITSSTFSLGFVLSSRSCIASSGLLSGLSEMLSWTTGTCVLFALNQPPFDFCTRLETTTTTWLKQYWQVCWIFKAKTLNGKLGRLHLWYMAATCSAHVCTSSTN